MIFYSIWYCVVVVGSGSDGGKVALRVLYEGSNVTKFIFVYPSM